MLMGWMKSSLGMQCDSHTTSWRLPHGVLHSSSWNCFDFNVIVVNIHLHHLPCEISAARPSCATHGCHSFSFFCHSLGVSLTSFGQNGTFLFWSLSTNLSHCTDACVAAHSGAHPDSCPCAHIGAYFGA